MQIRTMAKAEAQNAIQKQKHQFQDLAIMADWDSLEHTYRSMGA